MEPNPESKTETRSSSVPDTLWGEREEEDMCGGVWRAGVAKTPVISKGATDPSARSHQNPSGPLCGNCWWVLKSIWKCQEPGKGKAILEKMGRVGFAPPDPGCPTKPRTSGRREHGRGVDPDREQERLHDQTHKYEAHGFLTEAPRQSQKERSPKERRVSSGLNV